MTYRVRISGKAWESQAFGSDPHAVEGGEYADTPDLEAIFKSAKIIKRGRGCQVEVTGDADALEHLAEWFHNDGIAWKYDGAPENQAEARACLEAAQKIRAALKSSPTI